MTIVMTKNLPVEIVEQIIARMPYPSIFKCRCLSKSWLARFASISAEADKAKKRRAILFQMQVGEEWSDSWKTLCPIFAKNNRDFIGYDRLSHKWRRLPSLPFPEGTLRGKSVEKIQIEGALVYAFYRDNFNSEKYVANILTGAWKQLPACPNVHLTVLMEKLVTCAYSKFYKVILLCFCREKGSYHIGQHELYLQIYHSKRDIWTVKKVVFSCDLNIYDFNYGSLCPTMYLNGVLYIHGLQLNIKEGTLEIFDMQSTEGFLSQRRIMRIMMASWNGNLLIVLKKLFETHFVFGTGFKVLKFDFQSEQLSKLAECSNPLSDSTFMRTRGTVFDGNCIIIGVEGTLEINNLDGNLEPVFDGHCIFFGVEAEGTRILTYDVDKNDWSCFPIPAVTSYHEWEYKWVGSTFQPGLNPFAAV